MAVLPYSDSKSQAAYSATPQVARHLTHRRLSDLRRSERIRTWELASEWVYSVLGTVRFSFPFLIDIPRFLIVFFLSSSIRSQRCEQSEQELRNSTGSSTNFGVGVRTVRRFTVVEESFTGKYDSFHWRRLIETRKNLLKIFAANAFVGLR